MASSVDKLLRLSDGIAACDVAPFLGATIAGYWWERAGERLDWLRPAPQREADLVDPRQMGSFPLVPYSNRIRHSRFAFGRHQVTETATPPDTRHAIHGHGWRRAWDVGEQRPDRLVLEYVHRPAEGEPGAWPWAYGARQILALEAGALAIENEIENRSGEPMPAGLGQHPYFPRTPGATVTAAVREVWLSDAETLPIERAPVPAEWSLASGLKVADIALDNEFAGWDGRAVIAWPERRARLVLAADQPLLSFLVVYSPPGRDFFCVEPVSHLTDAFNLAGSVPDTGLSVLEPGASLRSRMVLRPELL